MPKIRLNSKLGRRGLLRAGAGLVAASAFGRSALGQLAAPPVVTSDKLRPAMPFGVQSGDIVDDRAIVWSKTDRPAQLVVEWATNEKFQGARRVVGPAALDIDDFTARIDLSQLPAGQQIFYRAMFRDLSDLKTMSAPVVGQFRTVPAGRRDVLFAFSGDEAGQGWGINPAWGGMKLYESMRRMQPDFFIHQGDQIYADGVIEAETKLDDGTLWKNITTPEKAHVAQSLADFRGAFAYNFLDENKRRFTSEVPFVVQWDDHETRNNWYPGQTIGAKNYEVTSTSLLAARGRRAMFDYNAMRINADDPERIYRSFAYGPSLEVFMLDERSYRGPNTPNRQTAINDESAFLGTAQMRWLKAALLKSRATWKVIASDMPISIVVPDLNADVPKGTFEAWANADNGAPAGRELELANLFSFIKNNAIRNLVWITADVHYASVTRYDPARAQFTDFDPFWEIVSGPINAGTFGPGEIDQTFGPEVKYVSIPADLKQNRPPSDGLQFFATGKIDGKTDLLTMSIHDLNGKVLHKLDIEPVA
jgi:alkaline phosphatase D